MVFAAGEAFETKAPKVRRGARLTCTEDYGHIDLINASRLYQLASSQMMLQLVQLKMLLGQDDGGSYMMPFGVIIELDRGRASWPINDP
jgi:hypothetical protein